MASRGQGSERPPFPFVVGSGRSGTTLLRAMLDCHPRMAVPPETYFITELLECRSSYESSGGFDVDAFASDLLANQWFRRWGLPAEESRAELVAAAPRDYPDAIRSAYEQYARSRGKPRYADKTPVYVYHVEALAELFPEACFIHLIRDGRDVASSFLERDDMRPTGIAEAALLWRERVDAGRVAGRRIGHERYLELRYEDLVASTEPALRRVSEFCGLDYHPQMLTYVERAPELAAVDGGESRHRGLFEPPTPGLRDWRSRLSAAAVETFELIAGDLLEELGYERATQCDLGAERPAVRLLAEELASLRLELVTVDREQRRRVRAAREEARKARRRIRRLKRRLERAEGRAPR